MLQPDAGQILLDGLRCTSSRTATPTSPASAAVYQELSLVPNLSWRRTSTPTASPCGPNFIDWERLQRQPGSFSSASSSEAVDPRTPVKDLSVARRQVVEILKAMSGPI